MRTRTRTTLAVVLGMAALGWDAAPAAAQDDRDADLLEARAAELALDRGTFEDASALYRRVARLRAGQTDAPDAWSEAARLAFYAGATCRALMDFIEAGNAALVMGDVPTAAAAYADAAWVAWRTDRPHLARDFTEKAERLGRSTLLSEAQRTAILRRVTRPGL